MQRDLGILRWTAAAVLTLSFVAAAAAQPVPASVLDGLELRAIGPAVMGGRIDDLAVDESRPWIFYLGTASGGLWKTTNAGTTWTSLFDDQPVSSIGDVALAPSDPEIVWVGTGEPNNRQSSTVGRGVFKSTDGGASWDYVGLTDTHHIGRVAIHPSDPATVYVAAVGHLWGPNAERGVFRTSDGGKSWDTVLFIDEDTGVVDLAMDPTNPRILYAAAYQRRRTPWGFAGSGPGSGLYKTTDAGETWRRLERGLPEGPLGRIGLAVHRADPRIVYATVQHGDAGGVYRSVDRGETWEQMSDLNPRPMYYSKIRVDPNDASRVYVLGAPFYVSDDDGRTFTRNIEMSPTYDVGVHGDHHALWVDPANSRHLILGGDGGLYVSWDTSATWDKVNNIPLGQFYAVGVDLEMPYNIYGGLQDTHSWGGPSATRRHIGILNGDWSQINFGDGMYQQVDPTDPDTIYTESQGGNIVRFNRATGDRKAIKPYPPAGDEAYRFHWTSPIAISPHDANRIYLGGNRLFTSSDRGETWSASSDLTRAEDRDELPIMGRVPDDTTLSRHDGTSSWGTITTLAESPVAAGVLWIGTDDGLVQVSRDEGQTWTSQSGRFPGLDDARALVSRVVASNADPGRAYAAFDRHSLDDFRPYLFTTDDYGGSWRALGSALPDDAGWVNVVVEHPTEPDLLFAGTETGLFVSIDRGATWSRLRGNFPTVPVDDLVIHPRDHDLVVGTHGRSLYVLDDLAPLVELSGEVLRSPAHLFGVRTAIQFHLWKHESYGAQRQFVGANPPYGAIVTYYRRDADADAAPTLTVVDADGRTVRTLDGEDEPGLHRVAWDLRTSLPDGLDTGRGPLVPPGRYAVRLEAAGARHEQTFEVTVDPGAARVTASEHQARYDFLTAVNAARGTVGLSVARLEAVTDQVQALVDREDERPATVADAATELLDRASGLLETLRGPDDGPAFGNPNLRSDASRLFGELDGGDVQQGTFGGPTAVQRARLVALRDSLAEAVAGVNALLATEVPALNQAITEVGLPWILAAEPLELPR
ncbi:MAG: hypothetical protein QF463_07205 [Vicinamibacterales bacterium]|jgi:hypothetical protein|nr:hypothetical protein [Acidobacteriota bacterium]MDP6371983.1 hypothetical protein [Vicinamibacterales bacterium]MDP6608836.1 hypothetical protein [Vicinamibacterales bacterium]|tara:strand:- start:1768 stop:4890 length:3123 start_codon:yes stop_codon:yes gene_type:complete